MKRLILISTVLLGISLCARADDSDDPFSDANSLLDGRAWVQMNTLAKLMYLRSAHDAVAIAPVFMIAHGGIPDPLEEISFIGLSYAEVQAALDVFYTNSSNVRIPILMAFKWVKLRGPEREAEAVKLRSFYPKEGKQKK